MVPFCLAAIHGSKIEPHPLKEFNPRRGESRVLALLKPLVLLPALEDERTEERVHVVLPCGRQVTSAILAFVLSEHGDPLVESVSLLGLTLEARSLWGRLGHGVLIVQRPLVARMSAVVDVRNRQRADLQLHRGLDDLLVSIVRVDVNAGQPFPGGLEQVARAFAIRELCPFLLDVLVPLHDLAVHWVLLLRLRDFGEFFTGEFLLAPGVGLRR
mmetsp:Transcript_5262/g.11265  ORF Transcript_5262/g.11265 Transcript_5262/m.11265 type:complete len:214 (-) Transcript_5262:359-1000(-)